MRAKRPWSLFIQLYWVVSLVFAAGFTLFYLSQGNLQVAAVTGFFIAAGVGLYFATARLPVLGIAAHQTLAMGLAYWLEKSGLLTGASLESMTTMAPMLGVLVVMTAGVFLGWAGVASALGLYGLLFAYLGGSPITLVPALVASVMALGMHHQLRRLETMQAELERLAIQDPMTGVFNRRLLQTEFDRYQALSSRQNVPLVVISWDLDDLKRINDSQGHAAGDRAILGLVKALKHNLRQEDVLFRMGGDEFLSLHLGLHNPAEVVERVLGGSPPVSVGWAEAGQLELETAVHRADEAMYLHKRGRRRGRALN